MKKEKLIKAEFELLRDYIWAYTYDPAFDDITQSMMGSAMSAESYNRWDFLGKKFKDFPSEAAAHLGLNELETRLRTLQWVLNLK